MVALKKVSIVSRMVCTGANKGYIQATISTLLKPSEAVGNGWFDIFLYVDSG